MTLALIGSVRGKTRRIKLNKNKSEGVLFCDVDLHKSLSSGESVEFTAETNEFIKIPFTYFSLFKIFAYRIFYSNGVELNSNACAFQ